MKCRWGSTMLRPVIGRVLSGRKDKDGYLDYALCVDGSKRNGKAHRLVAEHFISNPKGLIEVNHRDLNKANNVVSNLEWSTRKGNQQHARSAGLFHAASNTNRAKKLTIEDVREMRRMYLMGEHYTSVATWFPITPSSCHAIATGKSWWEVI